MVVMVVVVDEEDRNIIVGDGGRERVDDEK